MHFLAKCYLIRIMDIRQIRRQNLEQRIAAHGSIKRLALLTGTDPNYLSQIRGGSREMGHDIARKLEAGLKEEEGSMDQVQQVIEEAHELFTIWKLMTPEDREAWIKHGRLLTGKAKQIKAAHPLADTGTEKRTEPVAPTAKKRRRRP